MSSNTLKKTPLHQEHIKRNAQMASFGGWDMPIQYAGILTEHKHCRMSVSLFDICHMGEFQFKGDIEKCGIEKAFSFPISKIPVGKCRYGFILNKKGGIIDDLIVYRVADDELMIVVNASTTENDFKTIKKQIKGKAAFMNISENTVKLDIQGPGSRTVLAEKFGKDVFQIPYFGFKKMNILGIDGIISRTGYTGELGYEIYVDKAKAVELWNTLLSDPNVQPAGLGARDILRLEMGYSLYGHDIDAKTTPPEAGLDNFVDYNREFTGKKALIALKKKGLKKTRIAFKLKSRRSPRQHYEIWFDGKKRGEVTSGGYSPMAGCGIGLGYVPPELAKLGNIIVIKNPEASDTASEMEAEVTATPFYRNGTLRN